VSIEALNRIPALSMLPTPALDQLEQAACSLSHERGEIYYEQGSAPTGLYAIQSGFVKLYRESRDRVQILAIVTPGNCFGAESLSTDAPSPCNAVALTPTTTIHIPPTELRQIMREHAEVQVVLLELVTARLKQFVSLVHNLAFRDVAARLATFLVEQAEDQGEITGEGVRIERLLSQQELAALVGTAREVIYRTLKKFEQDGLVRLTRKEILLLDVDRLAEIAEQEAH
jgi:CRP/FNR family transcriptional regulator